MRTERARTLTHLLSHAATFPTVCRAAAAAAAANRREEGAVKRLRGRGCFTVAAATAPGLLGQV